MLNYTRLEAQPIIRKRSRRPQAKAIAAILIGIAVAGLVVLAARQGAASPPEISVAISHDSPPQPAPRGRKHKPLSIHSDPQKRDAAADAAAIHGLVGDLHLASADEQHLFLRDLRKIISHEDPPIDAIIAANAVPIVVKLLQVDPVDAQTRSVKLDAAWVVTNIASGSDAHVKAVVDADALPLLLQMAKSDDIEMQDQAIWALANIAGDSRPYRDLCSQNGVSQILRTVIGKEMQTGRSQPLENALWAMSNMMRYSLESDLKEERSTLILMQKLLTHKQVVIVENALYIVYEFVKEPLNADYFLAISDCSLQVIKLCTSAKKNIQRTAMSTLHTVLSFEKGYAVLVEQGLIPAIRTLLEGNDRRVQAGAAELLRLLLSDKNSADIVFMSTVPQMLLELLHLENSASIEAAQCIAVVAERKNVSAVNSLMSYGCIESLAACLESRDDLARAAIIALAHIARVRGLLNTDLVSLLRRLNVFDTVSKLGERPHLKAAAETFAAAIEQ